MRDTGCNSAEPCQWSEDHNFRTFTVFMFDILVLLRNRLCPVKNVAELGDGTCMYVGWQQQGISAIAVAVKLPYPPMK